MRVAIVTESFLPQANGVTNTVCHVVDHLLATGHEPLVVAPGPGPTTHGTAPVVRVRSVALPGYPSFRVGLPDRAVLRALVEHRADVAHLASPIALGAVGLRAARRLGLPSVAVYQTDVAGFARQYGIAADPTIARWVRHLHRRASRTLVPSTASHEQLAALGIPALHLWRRGVDLDLFDPEHRDRHLAVRWRGGPGSRDVVVGYVGRLAAEKQVHRLAELGGVAGARLVVVGDGPARPWLEKRLPEAVFTGMLTGADLARAFASLDVFVHTGANETFCQTVQEAQASGVAVVAPAAGGPLDLVASGRTGLLYHPDEPGDLRRAVTALVRNPALRRGLAEHGRRAVAGCGWAGVVDELVEHYRAVLPAAAGGVAA